MRLNFDLTKASFWVGSSGGGVSSEGAHVVVVHDEEIEIISDSSTGEGDSGGGDVASLRN